MKSEEGGGGGGYKEEGGELPGPPCVFGYFFFNFKEEEGKKSNLSSLGRSKCSSAHSAHSLIKKSTGMLLGSWAHIQ